MNWATGYSASKLREKTYGVWLAATARYMRSKPLRQNRVWMLRKSVSIRPKKALKMYV